MLVIGWITTLLYGVGEELIFGHQAVDCVGLLNLRCSSGDTAAVYIGEIIYWISEGQFWGKEGVLAVSRDASSRIACMVIETRVESGARMLPLCAGHASTSGDEFLTIKRSKQSRSQEHDANVWTNLCSCIEFTYGIFKCGRI